MGLIDKFLGPPSRNAFAKSVLKALRTAGDPRDAVYNADEFQLRYLDDDGHEIGLTNLHNLYEEHCLLPRTARKGHLKHVVRALLSDHKEIPEDYEDAKPDLLPIVRTRSYLELFRMRQSIDGQPNPEIPWSEVGEHFASMLVYDLPESMRTLPQSQLDEWNVSFYESMEVARENLAEIGFAFASISNSVYASITNDNYDASRVLLTDLIERLEVDGNPVVLIPNRDTLLITGSEDEEGLQMIAQMALEALEHPRSMIAVPMTLNRDEWITWEVPRYHPAADTFKELRVRSLYGDYAKQKSMLEEQFELENNPTFVASYSAIEEEKNGLYSYSVWSEGVDTLLPQTDIVIFYAQSEEIVASGTWERVQEICGHLMEATDHYPARYHITTFPVASELADVGKLELES